MKTVLRILCLVSVMTITTSCGGAFVYERPLTYAEIEAKSKKAVDDAIKRSHERYDFMKKQKQQNPSRVLDLHGVKHEDVDIKVENFVLLSTGNLTIITGKSFKMSALVANVLTRHDIKYDVRLDLGKIIVFDVGGL